MSEPSDYYRNTVAVVTGAASGIGAALAELLLVNGARRVVLADVSDERVEQHSARLRDGYPEKVLGIRCDVTKEQEVQTMIREAAAFGEGRIDLLSNNAGAGFSGRFDEQGNDDWERAFALNFFGPLYGIRAVLPIMRANGGGHIVDIISGIAFSPMAYQARYAATKAALNALTLALRYELCDENIRVTSATPGTTATPIWEAVADSRRRTPKLPSSQHKPSWMGSRRTAGWCSAMPAMSQAPDTASPRKPPKGSTSTCSMWLANGARATGWSDRRLIGWPR